MTTITVELTETATLTRLLGRPQKWRWVARDAGNHEVMAVSSESYTNRNDCLDAIETLFSEGTDVFLRTPDGGDQLLRKATR